MPQDIINVGTSANDGTGEGLRSAFQKINGMFSEIYNALTSLNTAVSARAPKTTVIGILQPQTVAVEQKIQHAVNAGTLVPLFAELVPPQSGVASGVHQVMTLPASFHIYDAALTFDQAQAGTNLTAVLERQLENLTWETLFTATGGITSRRFALGTRTEGLGVGQGTRLRLRIPALTTSGYDGGNMGLQLWIRGVWGAVA